MKKSYLKRKKPWKPTKRTILNARASNDTNDTKDRIQALCRSVAIIRDGGCVLRAYPEAGACGGYRKDGELILQYDHLNSRVHSVSFGDTRLGVLLCKRHHIFWKKQYPAQYEKLVRKIIGKERCKLLDRVRADHRPYKMDWKLVEIGLTRELENML